MASGTRRSGVCQLSAAVMAVPAQASEPSRAHAGDPPVRGEERAHRCEAALPSSLPCPAECSGPGSCRTPVPHRTRPGLQQLQFRLRGLPALLLLGATCPVRLPHPRPRNPGDARPASPVPCHTACGSCAPTGLEERTTTAGHLVSMLLF